MKRLDALVLKELVGPWVFGVGMFTVLLFSATYMVRVTNYIAQGVPLSTVVKITILLLPAFLVQTFAMALLLGGLLSFGRLSGDSEITAVRAAGVSLYRIIAPVSVFSMLVAGVAFWLNEQVVPGAARTSATMMIDLANKGQVQAGQPINQTQVQNGRVVAMLSALNFSLIGRTMQGVTVIAFDNAANPSYILHAKELDFTDLQKWRILGEADLVSWDGSFHVKLQNGAWPEQIPALNTNPYDLFQEQNTDPSVMSMAETRRYIERGNALGTLTPASIRDYEYKYWNKIALPLAAFIFGTLGATLGIRSHRTGAATGFAVSVVIIFVYFMLANFMNVFARSGIFPAYIASFTPIAIGLVASGVIIWQRNR